MYGLLQEISQESTLFCPTYSFEFNCMHFIIFWKFEYFTVFWFGPADISIERSWITCGLKPEAVKSSIIWSVPADWWCGRSLNVGLFNEGWNQRWTKETPVVLLLLSLEKQKEWGFERVTGSTHIPYQHSLCFQESGSFDYEITRHPHLRINVLKHFKCWNESCVHMQHPKLHTSAMQ